MPIGLFGKKLGMTQILEDSGTIYPVTIVKTESCQVSQIKLLILTGIMPFKLLFQREKIQNNKTSIGSFKKIYQ